MSNDEYYDDVIDPDLVDGFHPVDEDADILEEDDELDLLKKPLPLVEDDELDPLLADLSDEEDDLADFLEHEDY